MKMEVKTSDLAERITRAYNEYFHKGETTILQHLSPEDIKGIVKRGDLKSMVYITVYTNELEARVDAEAADYLRGISYQEQMRKLQEACGQKIKVHSARFLSKPSSEIDDVLKSVYPFGNIDIGGFLLPFVGLNEGICAIGTEKDNYLYVNPQLFNTNLINPVISYNGVKSDTEFVKAYYDLLVKTFGREAVDSTRPWLKEGKLIKCF